MRQKPIRRFPIGRRVRLERCDDFGLLHLGPAPAPLTPSASLRGASRLLAIAAFAKKKSDAAVHWFQHDRRRKPFVAAPAQRLLTQKAAELEPDATVGPMLTAPDAPRLFRFLGRTARRMHAPPPTEVRISYLPACGVMELPNIGPFPRRVLIIGYPCLQIWNQAEFAAVLGHEFAHWRNKDAKISKRLLPLLGEGRRRGPKPHWTKQLAIGTLSLLFRKPAIAICRRLEYRADAASANAFGPDSLASALRKLAVAQPIFDQILIDCAGRPSSSGNVYRQFIQAWRRIPQDLARRLLLRNVAVPPPPNDLHPPLADRLARLDKSTGPEFGARPSALRLVENRPQIATVLHNRIFADRVEKVSVFHRD